MHGYQNLFKDKLNEEQGRKTVKDNYRTKIQTSNCLF